MAHGPAGHLLLPLHYRVGTVIQEGFRWRNDDGSETSATWIEAQDVDASLELDETARLRVLLDSTGDPDPAAYTLYYRKAAIEPTDVAGCELWLDADDASTFTYSSGVTVSAWADKSGSSHNASQGSTGDQPTRQTSVVNGRAIVRFDADTDWVQTGTFANTFTAGDLYVVVKNNTANGVTDNALHAFWDTSGNSSHFPDSTNTLYEAWGSTSRKNAGTPAALNTWRLYNVRTAAGAYSIHLDGTQIYSTGTNSVGFANVGIHQIGHRQCDIAEWIVYDNVIGSTDRADLHQYIADKYGLTIAGVTASEWLPVPVGPGSGSGTAYESSTVTSYTTRTNTTITAPSGIIDGDVLILGIYTLNPVGDAVDPTPPAGFTLVGTPADRSEGGQNFEGRLFLKVASGESGDYTFTHASSISQGFALRYSGVDTTTPLDTTPTTNTGDDGATASATGLTTVTNNAMLVFTSFGWDGSAGMSPPSGMTERIDSVVLYVADAVQASAGASGSKAHVITDSGGASPWGAMLVALRPALLNPVYIAPSANITAGGQDTTAQLTAPAGKTTADFSVGRMWDDENGTDPVDIGAWSPLNLTGLVGWWRSDGVGNTTAQWNDESGNGHHFTQATGGNQPTRSTTINGRTVYTTNGSSQGMQAASTTNMLTGTTMTVAVVARSTDWSSGHDDRLISCRPSGGADWSSVAGFYTGIPGGRLPGFRRSGYIGPVASTYLNTATLWVTVFNGSNGIMYINGALQETVASSGSFDVDDVWLSTEAGLSAGVGGWIGDIAEIVVCSTALSDTDRGDLETYLTDKWGL